MNRFKLVLARALPIALAFAVWAPGGFQAYGMYWG
jgi:hypothetical protein